MSVSEVRKSGCLSELSDALGSVPRRVPWRPSAPEPIDGALCSAPPSRSRGRHCLVAARINESELSNNHPTILVEKIRRQLMNENYDYMPSESEERFPIRHELSNEGSTRTTPPSHEHADNTAIDLDSEINEQYIPRANDLDTKDDFNDDNSHAISKKDLLYYVDDDRLKHEADEKLEDKVTVETTTSTAVETTSPKVKYKILKVKQSHPNRRSQSFRRFIQEEGDNGVVIINLNDEPFPEFRLPRGRRQYMMDHEQGFHSGVEAAPRSDPEERTSGADKKLFDHLDRIAKVT